MEKERKRERRERWILISRRLRLYINSWTRLSDGLGDWSNGLVSCYGNGLVIRLYELDPIGNLEPIVLLVPMWQTMNHRNSFGENKLVLRNVPWTGSAMSVVNCPS